MHTNKEHLPAIEATPSLELRAIYSRSQKSAKGLATQVKSGSSVDVYYDSPAAEDKSLNALLKRDDVAAVVIALPILAQPAIIECAIRAGKHVLSEKPVAKDVAEAKRLIGWYDALPAGGKPLWAVAENWRYLASLEYAAQRVKELGGEVATFRLERNGFVKRGDKYFETECEYPPLVSLLLFIRLGWI